MSDFERRILEKAQNLQTEEMRRAAEHQAQQAAEAAKTAEFERRALELGVEVVRLLQKYNVPSTDIWESRPTGEIVSGTSPGRYGPSSYSRKVMDYFRAGQGWFVCDVFVELAAYDMNDVTHAVGISDTGQVIENPHFGTLRRRSGEQATGLTARFVNDPERALLEIQSHDFQNGVASLINGNGTCRARRNGKST